MLVQQAQHERDAVHSANLMMQHVGHEIGGLLGAAGLRDVTNVASHGTAHVLVNELCNGVGLMGRSCTPQHFRRRQLAWLHICLMTTVRAVASLCWPVSLLTSRGVRHSCFASSKHTRTTSHPASWSSLHSFASGVCGAVHSPMAVPVFCWCSFCCVRLFAVFVGFFYLALLSDLPTVT